MCIKNAKRWNNGTFQMLLKDMQRVKQNVKGGH